MKIIILGAGQVGGTLAENLAREDNDVTLIDTNIARLNELRDRLDIGTVHGHGSTPSVLKQAGIEDADLLVAVTSTDEVNMVACQIGHTLFHTPTRIARIRAPGYTVPAIAKDLFSKAHMPVDVVITPEQLVTEHIQRLIEQPGTLQVLDFADGLVQLVAVRAYEGGPLVGQELRALREHMPSVDARVAAIFRKDRAITPEGNTVIEDGDEVFFIATKNNIRKVMSELRKLERPYKRLMIAGGGNIGLRLSQALEKQYNVKIIEMFEERCQYLSEVLDHAVVLNGQAADQELMLEEGVDSVDVFLALTNNDAANIMASMLAKRLGASKVMTLINTPAYADLVQGGTVDIAISPQQITTSSLLSYVRKGDTVRVHSLRRGAAEAIEIIAHGDKRSSKVVGRTIEEINLPPGTTIGAIVREGKRGPQVIMGHHDVVIENDDHVIVFLVDKRRTKDIEKLFQVGFTFF
ncbi:Trk system potassium transporter TrkA [Porticoccus sp. W117]|uniref:Trk system potassium transporter TrkA n=1 Tax=Porticoccus sp. W117 TaxID=3054777 RepID=UPI00259A79B4|nr:Trk system potassium transporter TrkA [Porticoccus sp. W117]MDM3870455.1 Trk system potassium transporter TrkA [Porticoccus sp. W117]